MRHRQLSTSTDNPRRPPGLRCSGCILACAEVARLADIFFIARVWCVHGSHVWTRCVHVDAWRQIWLQDEDDGGAFIMQFDEVFSCVNLGDSGVMYVFDDTAYRQCY